MTSRSFGPLRGAVSILTVVAYSLVVILTATVVTAGYSFQQSFATRTAVSTVVAVVEAIYNVGTVAGRMPGMDPWSLHCTHDVASDDPAVTGRQGFQLLRDCGWLPATLLEPDFAIRFYSLASTAGVGSLARGDHVWHWGGDGSPPAPIISLASPIPTVAGGAGEPTRLGYYDVAETDADGDPVAQPFGSDVPLEYAYSLYGPEDFILALGSDDRPLPARVCADLLRRTWPRAVAVRFTGGLNGLAMGDEADDLPHPTAAPRLTVASLVNRDEGGLGTLFAIDSPRPWQYATVSAANLPDDTVDFVFHRTPGAAWHPAAPYFRTYRPELVFSRDDDHDAEGANTHWPFPNGSDLCYRHPVTHIDWPAGSPIGLLITFAGGPALAAE